MLHPKDPKANQALNKVIHDLPTGEIVSLPGKLIIDAGALGMLILTGTGFYLWWKPRRIRAGKAAVKVTRSGAETSPIATGAHP